MSYLAATPDAFVSAASDLAGIVSILNSAHTAAAPQTTAVPRPLMMRFRRLSLPCYPLSHW